VSGDLRRALEICRRSSEIAELRCKAEAEAELAAGGTVVVGRHEHVVIQDVFKAVADMSTSSNIQNIVQQPLYARLVLCVLANEAQRRDEGMVQYEALVARFKDICRRLSVADKLEKERVDGAAEQLQLASVSTNCRACVA
jgi:Cdc6-like AAA superfamily ATPase